MHSQFAVLQEILGSQFIEANNDFYKCDEYGNIVWISLRGKGLEEIPSSIDKWTSLKQIDLSGNNLRSLPEEVIGWTNIENVDISNNFLEYLPEGVKGWRSHRMG